MPYVDLAFRLTGSKVPVDHGYALYSVISRILPEIHGAKNIDAHPNLNEKNIWPKSERNGGELSYT